MTDTYLGQILHEGKWLDYARGQKDESIRWAKGDRDNRRVVDWIKKEQIIFPDPPPVFYKADFGLPLGEYGWPICELDDVPASSDNHQWDEDPKADNHQRAALAADALKQFASTHGLDDIDTAMSDFLGNFMHLCDGLGMSFEDMVDRARFHYEPETRGVL